MKMPHDVARAFEENHCPGVGIAEVQWAFVIREGENSEEDRNRYLRESDPAEKVMVKLLYGGGGKMFRAPGKRRIVSVIREIRCVPMPCHRNLLKPIIDPKRTMRYGLCEPASIVSWITPTRPIHRTTS